MADEARIREMLDRYFEYTGADVDRAEEFYHEDAVLEFPQSGERFEGRAVFTEWRSQYPTGPDDLRYRVVRVTARDDFSAVELQASYDQGETWMHGVQLLDFRGTRSLGNGSTLPRVGRPRSGEPSGGPRQQLSEPNPVITCAASRS